MNPLRLLDARLLDATQRVTQGVQRWTGRLYTWQYRQTLYLSLILDLVDAGITQNVAEWIDVAFLAAITIYLQRIVTDALALQLARYGLRNTLQVSACWLRLLMVGLGLLYPVTMRLTLAGWCDAVSMELQVVSVYLLSCDALPPGESKIGAWWRSWRAARPLVPATEAA